MHYLIFNRFLSILLAELSLTVRLGSIVLYCTVLYGIVCFVLEYRTLESIYTLIIFIYSIVLYVLNWINCKVLVNIKLCHSMSNNPCTMQYTPCYTTLPHPPIGLLDAVFDVIKKHYNTAVSVDLSGNEIRSLRFFSRLPQVLPRLSNLSLANNNIPVCFALHCIVLYSLN